MPREGTLLPETYRFTRGMTREQILQRMQHDEQRVLAEIWEHRTPDLPLKTPEQLVTLASIVEKETGRAGRAHARRGGLHQPAQAQDAAAVRPDHHLRPGRRQGHARPPDHEERDRAADAVQYLRHRRPAAGPDRQSRAAPRSKPSPIRRAPRTSFSSPTAPAATSSSETYEQHQKNVARLRALGAIPTPHRPAMPRRKRRQAPRRRADACPCEPHRRAAKVAHLFRRSARDGNADGPVEHDRLCRSHGVAGAYAWAWELKSVNAKGLDLRLRLPPGWDAIEVPARARVADKLSRGTVYANSQRRARRRGAGRADQRGRCWPRSWRR